MVFPPKNRKEVKEQYSNRKGANIEAFRKQN